MITDEDADLREHLAVFGPDAIAELRRVLEAPSEYRTAVLQATSASSANVGLFLAPLVSVGVHVVHRVTS